MSSAQELEWSDIRNMSRSILEEKRRREESILTPASNLLAFLIEFLYNILQSYCLLIEALGQWIRHLPMLSLVVIWQRVCVTLCFSFLDRPSVKWSLFNLVSLWIVELTFGNLLSCSSWIEPFISSYSFGGTHPICVHLGLLSQRTAATENRAKLKWPHLTRFS